MAAPDTLLLTLTPAGAARLGVAPGVVECRVVTEAGESFARVVIVDGEPHGTIDIGPDGVLSIEPEPTED